MMQSFPASDPKNSLRRPSRTRFRGTCLHALTASLVLATGFAACSGPENRPLGETLGTVRQALSCDGGGDACVASDGDGGASCTLADATTAGLQGDCANGLWCNLSTNQCQSALLAPGTAIPLPNAQSGCSDIAAWSACATGVCNLAHTACGCQADQDCPAQQTCDPQAFDCVAPGASDAGGDASAVEQDGSSADASGSGDSSTEGGAVVDTGGAEDAGSVRDAAAGDAALPSDAAARSPAAVDSGTDGRAPASGDSPLVSGTGVGSSSGGCNAAGKRGCGAETLAFAALLLQFVLRRRRRTTDG